MKFFPVSEEVQQFYKDIFMININDAEEDIDMYGVESIMKIVFKFIFKLFLFQLYFMYFYYITRPL